ncbi:MAG: DUF2490 domain-containing protein [Planctomycetes bacterium]|nr:DUF2490 domain-containing protein [Planctomycetota bacterium]
MVLVSIVGGNCFGSTDGNAEYWQVFGFDYEIYENWKVTVREELKFGRSGGEPYNNNTDVGIVYKGFADWLDVGMNFKKEYERDSSRNYRDENRPHINLMFKGELDGYKLGDRVRLEYRDKETSNTWRFRNRFSVNLPFKLTKFNLQPFVSDEIFINLGDSSITQNRFTTGPSFKLSENVKSSIYWMYKSNRSSSSEWIDANVIGTSFVFVF